MPALQAGFRNWLKSSTNMKLNSDAAVTRISHEGITNFDSLLDFDRKSILNLPSICKETIPNIPADAANEVVAEAAVPGANISAIAVQRLIISTFAASYYNSIGRTMTPHNMHYRNVLSTFKIEYEAYTELKSQDEPDIPKINDRDGDRKIIRWAPIFVDIMSRTYGTRGPLSYVLRDEVEVGPEVDDPLGTDPATGQINSYYGNSGSLHEELISRLPHNGPIYRNDNGTIFIKIEEAVRGTSVESTIKSFSRSKDGRGAYYALIANHAGETKYRSISKKRMNLLQNIKWNGRNYPFESHVSNHRQAFDDLKECSKHVTVQVPAEAQRVEYLIDSIVCNDNTLQATIGLVRANTNLMRESFERAASALIEVDPYKRAQRPAPTNRNANVSGIDFHAGRGNSGVDLRWHPRREFLKLPQNQKDELMEWLGTDPGRAHMAKYKEDRKRKSDQDNKKNGDRDRSGNWKKKLKKAIKTPNGLKMVMATLAKEEESNASLVAALGAQLNKNGDVRFSIPPNFPPSVAPLPPSSSQIGLAAALPATTIKLQSILKK